ncbi:MAG: alpha/beta hydrolase family protein [Rhodoglobus sp.]
MAGQRQPISLGLRVAAGVAMGVGALTVLGAVGSAGVALVFARAVITPPTKRAQDVRIRAVDDTTVSLSATIDSMTPGRYGLWFSEETGHARLGEIRSFAPDTVTRELLGVDFGDLSHATRGRLGSWFYLSPESLGLAFTDVAVATELGAAPAWLVPATEPTDRWVIQVHGRAVRRHETLRALPAFHAAGYTSLLISYRNDGDAPPSTDHRYALGDTEWRDVDAAMHYAVEHGAKQIVLMGWSMGGATVLQAVTRSPLAHLVRGVVLESPVVDWVTALTFQATINRLPSPARWVVLQLLSSRWAGILTGQSSPIDLRRLDLVARAAELTTPILLFHSEDDSYVPASASTALARARPDIVTYEHFVTAGHVRLWNYDTARWNAAITGWLAELE